MIDEKKLICSNCIHYDVCKMYGNYILHYDTTRKICGYFQCNEEQTKVDATDTNVGSKWIPCSERLPEEAGFYIVTKRQKSGEIHVALGSYRPLFNEWSGNGNFKEVIAWMPLPEPYEEDMRGGKNE